MFPESPIRFSPNTLSSVFRLNDSGQDRVKIAGAFSPTTPNYCFQWVTICLAYILIMLNRIHTSRWAIRSSNVRPGKK